MNSIAIIALISTVSAEVGYTCKQSEETGAVDWEVNADSAGTIAAATDTASCGKACTDLATAEEANDNCCFGVGDSATGASPAYTCSLWYAVAKDGETADLRVAKAADGTKTYDAWAWNKGTAAAAMTAADGDADADSATMISSAIATIAAIAMVAF